MQNSQSVSANSQRCMPGINLVKGVVCCQPDANTELGIGSYIADFDLRTPLATSPHGIGVSSWHGEAII